MSLEEERLVVPNQVGFWCKVPRVFKDRYRLLIKLDMHQASIVQEIIFTMENLQCLQKQKQ